MYDLSLDVFFFLFTSKLNLHYADKEMQCFMLKM